MVLQHNLYILVFTLSTHFAKLFLCIIDDGCECGFCYGLVFRPQTCALYHNIHIFVHNNDADGLIVSMYTSMMVNHNSVLLQVVDGY